MKETVATLGFILLFAGGMIAISGSSFVTHGAISPSKYLEIGIIELIGSIFFIAGLIVTIRSR